MLDLGRASHSMHDPIGVPEMNNKNRTQSELTTLLHGTSYSDQTQANGFLKQHGLTVEIRENMGIVTDDQTKQEVATIKFDGSGSNDRKIGTISY